MMKKVRGCTDWREEFYQKEKRVSLYEESVVEAKNADWNKITNFYKKQLEKIFTEVAGETAYLTNSHNNPLFAFIFVMTNPSENARKAALRISNFLLNPKRKPLCK